MEKKKLSFPLYRVSAACAHLGYTTLEIASHVNICNGNMRTHGPLNLLSVCINMDMLRWPQQLTHG